MYLQLWDSTGECGYVRVGPYEWEYTGIQQDVQEYLEGDEPIIHYHYGPPETQGSPVKYEIEEEEKKLSKISTELMKRRLWDTEIIYE